MASRRRLTLVLGAWLSSTRLPGVATEWAFGALEHNLGVTGRVEAVEFNPLTLVVRVSGLSLWAVGHDQDPFLSAEGATVDLPWSALLGTPAIESLDVEAPAVWIRRTIDGGSNLPQAPAGPEPALAPEASESWQLGVVELRRGRLLLEDESQALQVTIAPMRLRLDSDDGSARGRLTLERPTVVGWGGRQTAIEPSTVDLAFDGATLTIGELDLLAPEGRLRAAGVLVVAGGPRVRRWTTASTHCPHGFLTRPGVAGPSA